MRECSGLVQLNPLVAFRILSVGRQALTSGRPAGVHLGCQLLVVLVGAPDCVAHADLVHLLRADATGRQVLAQDVHDVVEAEVASEGGIDLGLRVKLRDPRVLAAKSDVRAHHRRLSGSIFSVSLLKGRVPNQSCLINIRSAAHDISSFPFVKTSFLNALQKLLVNLFSCGNHLGLSFLALNKIARHFLDVTSPVRGQRLVRGSLPTLGRRGLAHAFLGEPCFLALLSQV